MMKAARLSFILSLLLVWLFPLEAFATNTSGDVNNDGEVSIADVNAVIDVILSSSNNSSADVNNDGEVNIADVNTIIDIILSGSVNYDVQMALDELNQIYRSMYLAGWTTTGNTHQCFGISAYNLMAEVMGDDLIVGNQGSGWFWYDAAYDVKSRYIMTTWRSHDLWTAYYTWIAKANALLNKCKFIKGDTNDVNYVKGQAYAIRAYSYFMLAQSFARTYKTHENDPCVPIFDGINFNGSTGRPRSSTAQVYTQIDNDITQAIDFLSGTTQQSPNHIGFAVALGLQTRIALVKEDWSTALSYAIAAINASGKTILPISSFIGLNNVYANNVMWGADIPAEDSQTMNYANLFAHMSSSGNNNAYAARAPKQISKWLYRKMSSTDQRRNWWHESWSDWGFGQTYDYVQKKFDYSNASTWEGDYIWMRVEEMYLSAAEAACHLGDDNSAKQYLMALMNQRDYSYTCNKTGNALGEMTTDLTGSLLEEILIQRRLELWGEDGRIFTIRRLRQGFERLLDYGWPNNLLLQSHSEAIKNPDSYAWVLTIPYSEFSGNPNLNLNYDQNPLNDYLEVCSQGPQNVSFINDSQIIKTPDINQTITVTIKRATTDGPYYAVVRMIPSDEMTEHVNLSNPVAYFSNGQRESSINIKFSNIELGQDYYVDLVLSDFDIENSDSSLGATITSTRVIVKCGNENITGQHISFESSQQEYSSDFESHTVEIVLTRALTTNKYSAKLIMNDCDDEIISLYSPRVLFDEGKNTASTWLMFNNMEKGKSYTCKLTLSPEDISTVDPSLGEQITSSLITVSRNPYVWTNYGVCTYYSSLLGLSNIIIEKDVDDDYYRLVNFFDKGHDIIFRIMFDGKVYLISQPAFYNDSYGEVYIRGFANEDDSGYAGDFNNNLNQINLKLQYYVPDGEMVGIYNDVLIMPHVNTH